MNILSSSSKYFNLDGHGLSISNSWWSMCDQSPEDALHSCKNTCHTLHAYFQTHHSAAEDFNFTRTHTHTHVNMYRNNRVCKQSTATEGCHLFLTSIKKEAETSVESKYYMIATKKKTHSCTHTQPQQQQQQQHVPEPPAIRSDGWCTDPIRQIHTSRCSDIFPTKKVQINKMPSGKRPNIPPKGKRNITHSASALLIRDIFVPWRVSETHPPRQPYESHSGLEISKWDLGRCDLEVFRFDPYQL